MLFDNDLGTYLKAGPRYGHPWMLGFLAVRSIFQSSVRRKTGLRWKTQHKDALCRQSVNTCPKNNHVGGVVLWPVSGCGTQRPRKVGPKHVLFVFGPRHPIHSGLGKKTGNLVSIICTMKCIILSEAERPFESCTDSHREPGGVNHATSYSFICTADCRVGKQGFLALAGLLSAKHFNLHATIPF